MYADWRWRTQPSRACCPESSDADRQVSRGTDHGRGAPSVARASLQGRGATGAVPSPAGRDVQGRAGHRRDQRVRPEASPLVGSGSASSDCALMAKDGSTSASTACTAGCGCTCSARPSGASSRGRGNQARTPRHCVLRRCRWRDGGPPTAGVLKGFRPLVAATSSQDLGAAPARRDVSRATRVGCARGCRVHITAPRSR